MVPGDMAANSLTGARLGIVGTGVMAEAMLAGLLGQRLLEASRVRCSHPREARRALLDQTYQVGTTESNVEAVRDADIALLAVTPRTPVEAIPQLPAMPQPQPLVTTITAPARTP